MGVAVKQVSNGSSVFQVKSTPGRILYVPFVTYFRPSAVVFVCTNAPDASFVDASRVRNGSGTSVTNCAAAIRRQAFQTSIRHPLP